MAETSEKAIKLVRAYTQAVVDVSCDITRASELSKIAASGERALLEHIAALEGVVAAARMAEQDRRAYREGYTEGEAMLSHALAHLDAIGERAK